MIEKYKGVLLLNRKESAFLVCLCIHISIHKENVINRGNHPRIS